MTNGDRVKENMTLQDLLLFVQFCTYDCCKYCGAVSETPKCQNNNCTDNIAEWLKQEVSE